MEEETKTNCFRKKKLILSGNHLNRLNQINGKFSDPNLIKSNQWADRCFLNYQKFKTPTEHQYPKNPFSTDKNTVLKNTEAGSFHVGIKFLGKPEEMLKLVCLALIKIEIEWQYDPKEIKLKCRTKVDDEKLVDDDKFIEDFIRQQFLKFYVYIDKLEKG